MLAYYRHERIVVDIVALAEQILDPTTVVADRAQGLRYLREQFRPGNVVEQAHRVWLQLR